MSPVLADHECPVCKQRFELPVGADSSAGVEHLHGDDRVVVEVAPDDYRWPRCKSDFVYRVWSAPHMGAMSSGEPPR